MSIHGTTFVAVRAYIGNFQLKEPLKEKIESFNPYTVNHPVPDPRIKLYNGFFYTSVDPSKPMIGDVRVTFGYAGVSGPQGNPLGPADKVSIVAKQAGAMLTNYVDFNGESRQLLHLGEKSAEDMLISEYNLNNSVSWSLRIGGWVMIFLGLSFMRLLIFYIMDLVPALRKIAAFGLTNFNLCLSFSMAVFFMSLLYLVTRPFRALLMITVSLLPIIIMFVRQKLSRKDNLKI